MSDRKPLIAGNWKMHHTWVEAIHTVQKLALILDPDDYERADVLVCPSFTALRSVQTVIEADRLSIQLGAQNVHFEPQGAFTGEVSAPMLAKLACRYVIVGHSERREIFGETDEVVNRKVHAVLANGMAPILCVGETLAEREAGDTLTKIVGQVRAGFEQVKPGDAERCVIAYEPIWAIGTGRTATPSDANAAIGEVRGTVRELYGDAVADGMRILYGGSMKPGNAGELMAESEIDGGLVGGASLDADEFARIVRWSSDG